MPNSESKIATIVIPVLNEEDQVVSHASKVRDYLDSHGLAQAEIIIADNGSSDSTPTLAKTLAAERRGIVYHRRETPGRGGALRETWMLSDAPVVAYCDIDLSTSLSDMLTVFNCVIDRTADIAVASRLLPGSITTRSFKREVISRCYNAILRKALSMQVRDAQCGCKAVSRAAAKSLIPLVEDDHWFFDTELLCLAFAAGFEVREIPVEWRDDPGTRVKIFKTTIQNLRSIIRLWRTRSRRQAIPLNGNL